MNDETRVKAIIKFGHGCGPKQVALELGISVVEATRVQVEMSGQRPARARRRSTPRKK